MSVVLRVLPVGAFVALAACGALSGVLACGKELSIGDLGGSTSDSGLTDDDVVVPTEPDSGPGPTFPFDGSPTLPLDSGTIDSGNTGSDPVDGALGATSGVTPVLLYASPGVTSLATDSRFLYWTSAQGNAVFQAPLSGGGPVATIAAGQTYPVALAVANGVAFWGDAPGLSSGAAGGTDAVVGASVADDGGVSFLTTFTLSSNADVPTALAADGNAVYWLSTVAGVTTTAILEAPSGGDGGSVTTLVPAYEGPCGIAVAAGNVYWRDTANNIQSIPAGGGSVNMLVRGGGVADAGAYEACQIVADANALYWIDLAGLWRLPLVGGSPTLLSPPAGYIGALASDGTNVYFAIDDYIAKVPVGGGTVVGVTVAGTGYSPFCAPPFNYCSSIAVGPSQVYFADNAHGGIYTAPK